MTDPKTDRELIAEAQKAVWAEVHGQDPIRLYTVAEVKAIAYSLDNVITTLTARLERVKAVADGLRWATPGGAGLGPLMHSNVIADRIAAALTEKEA